MITGQGVTLISGRFVRITLRHYREVLVHELSVQADHVHVVCSTPPKVSVSSNTGLMKGKLASKLFGSYPALKKKPY